MKRINTLAISTMLSLVMASAAWAGGKPVTEVNAGPGLSSSTDETEITLSVDFGGNGINDQAARSDHDHDGQYSPVGHQHTDLQNQIDDLQAHSGRFLTADFQEAPEIVQKRFVVTTVNTPGVPPYNLDMTVDISRIPQGDDTVLIANDYLFYYQSNLVAKARDEFQQTEAGVFWLRSIEYHWNGGSWQVRHGVDFDQPFMVAASEGQLGVPAATATAATVEDFDEDSQSYSTWRGFHVEESLPVAFEDVTLLTGTVNEQSLTGCLKLRDERNSQVVNNLSGTAGPRVRMRWKCPDLGSVKEVRIDNNGRGRMMELSEVTYADE